MKIGRIYPTITMIVALNLASPNHEYWLRSTKLGPNELNISHKPQSIRTL
jgi:hypothetical protein